VAQLATNSKRLALVRISEVGRFPGTWPCMAQHRGLLVSCDMRGAVFTPFFYATPKLFWRGVVRPRLQLLKVGQVSRFLAAAGRLAE